LSSDGRYLFAVDVEQNLLFGCPERLNSLLPEIGVASGAVNFFELSPDGRLLLIGIGASTIEFWDATNLTFLRKQAVPGKALTAACFVEPGTVLIGNEAGEVIPLSVFTDEVGKPVWSGQRAIRALTWSSSNQLLAVNHWDTTASVVRIHPKDAFPIPPSTLTDGEFRRLWNDLESANVTTVWNAVRALSGAGDHAVRYLAAHQAPAEKIEPRLVAQWINQLDSSDNDKRREARANLSNCLDRVYQDLQKALLTPSAEQARSLRLLIFRANRQRVVDHRASRVIQVLEIINTLAARNALRQLAGGDPLAETTREANEAHRRASVRSR
jgi:hypothetical protein